MDVSSRRPVVTPSYAVVQTAQHQILVCKSCKPGPASQGAGVALLDHLRKAIAAAGLTDSFEVTGTACLAGCDRSCAAAWRAAGKATWVFGAIDPDQPVDDLITFSRLYRSLDDGWCAGADCPPKLRDNTLARIPAAVSATPERPAT